VDEKGNPAGTVRRRVVTVYDLSWLRGYAENVLAGLALLDELLAPMHKDYDTLLGEMPAAQLLAYQTYQAARDALTRASRTASKTACYKYAAAKAEREGADFPTETAWTQSLYRAEVFLGLRGDDHLDRGDIEDLSKD